MKHFKVGICDRQKHLCESSVDGCFVESGLAAAKYGFNAIGWLDDDTPPWRSMQSFARAMLCIERESRRSGLPRRWESAR